MGGGESIREMHRLAATAPIGRSRMSDRTSLTDEEIRTDVAQEIRQETADADMDDTDSDTDDTDSDSDSDDTDA
jgi:hypothetical protein